MFRAWETKKNSQKRLSKAITNARHSSVGLALLLLLRSPINTLPKMQKLLTTTLFLLICTICGFSQSRVYVKAYQNTDVFKRTENVPSLPFGRPIETGYSLKRFSRFSVGAGIETNKFWNHELEVSYSRNLPPIEHSSRIPHKSDDVKRHFFALQYDLYSRFEARGNWYFRTGFGISPYISSAEFSPDSPFVFPVTEQNIGATFNSSFTISYSLSALFDVELRHRVSVLNLNQYTSREDNPVLPEEERTINSGIVWDFLPETYTLAVGISYKIAGASQAEKGK